MEVLAGVGELLGQRDGQDGDDVLDLVDLLNEGARHWHAPEEDEGQSAQQPDEENVQEAVGEGSDELLLGPDEEGGDEAVRLGDGLDLVDVGEGKWLGEVLVFDDGDEVADDDEGAVIRYVRDEAGLRDGGIA